MILMLAPAPNLKFGAMPSGASYVSDDYGLIKIVNDSAADQAALKTAGCFTLTPFGGWGNFGFGTLADLYAADTGSILPGFTGYPQFTVATVFADGTSANDGTWYKSGTGSGSGNWTYVGAIVVGTSSANAIAAIVQPIADAAAASAATAQGAVAALVQSEPQYMGRPTPDVPIDSATSLGGDTYIRYEPATAASVLSEFETYAHGTGTIKFKSYTSSGAYYATSTLTKTISAPGPVTLTPSDFGTLNVPAGGYWGFYATGSVVPWTANPQDNPGWGSVNGDTTATWAPGSNMLSSSQRVEARGTLTAEVVAASPSVVGTILADLAALQVDAQGLADSLEQRVQTIGIVPTSGDPLANPYASVYGNSYSVDTSAIAPFSSFTLNIWALQAGNCQLIKGTVSGGVFTRTGATPLIAVAGAGLQPITVPGGFTLAPGERLFVWSPASGSGGCGLLYTNYTAVVFSTGPMLQVFGEAQNGASVGSFSNLVPGIQITGAYAISKLTGAAYSAINYSARRSTYLRTPLTSGYALATMSGGTWYHGVGYGQSNCLGALTGSVISASQPNANLTFGSGPRSSRAGNTWGALLTSPGTSTAIALVERNDATGADGGSNEQESPCSGEANWFTRLGIQRGATPANHVVFESTAGHGSYSISQLSKSALSTAWYNQIRSHVVDAKALATAAAKGYAIQTVSWVQGEQDAALGTSYATYLAALKQLASDLDTDLRSDAGGQAEHVHMLIAGTASATSSGSLTTLGNITQAQFDAAHQSPNIHFVTPMYPFYWQFSTGLHLLAQGALRMGRYFGRARDQLVKESRKPDYLEPLSATIVGAGGQQITVRFNVPTAPLVLDVTQLQLATNYGIKVVDDSGALTLSNIAVGGDGLSLTMNVNRTLSTNPYLRIARDYLAPDTVITNGASSNIRDSTGDFETCEVAGIVYRMDHWCPAVQLPIVALEA